MGNLVSQALNKANMGIMIVDRQLKVVVWNGWLERLTGKSREEVVGQNLLEVCPRFKSNVYLNILQNALYHGQSRFCSSALHKAFILPNEGEDEHLIRQNMHVEPLYQEDRCYALIQITDMTNMNTRVYKLKNLIKELETEYTKIKISEKISKHMSLHDPLTGLPNRLAYNDRLAWAISNAQRSDSRLAVMFVDADGFKQVNDTYGHDVGDQVLLEMAKRLSETIPTTDTVARLGGDEFIILSHLKDDHDADIIAKQLEAAFSTHFKIAGNYINLSISIGISLFPKHGQEPSELLRHADRAMYKIKKNGKNGYGIFEPESDE
ncbi:sensor domain-containing diguanylate cyclase [Paenibacillus amylolyticus]|uniref:Diguanylate cyclase/phosphodiesterase n=1 Tax=Paenibacillus amylolyticus TaxID=1451 RepID=A0A117I187_PAEAM|nr:sensor domain-containing diguanylate cyclase [Paenibacillus amylolyticus]GAS81782.1 diguanylate cyclase/phosphodiesterase [Paenibacillus amylolyticus]